MSRIVKGLRKELEKNPQLAKLTQKAKIKKIGIFQSEIKIGRNKIIFDEDTAIGGSNAGPNASSIILGAIGGCLNSNIEAWSQILDIPIDSVEISVKGTLDLRGMLGLDESIKPEYQNIDIVVSVKSPADEGKIKELLDNAESHCPVLNTVRNPINVKTSLKYEKTD